MSLRTERHEETGVFQAGPFTHRALTLFFAFAAVMSIVAGITLLQPQTPLTAVWAIKPNDYRNLLAFAPWSGLGFLLLSALMATAAWGTSHRTPWSLRLSIAILVANGIGDMWQMLNGRAAEGALGVIVTGALVYWLTRRKVRESFDRGVR